MTKKLVLPVVLAAVLLAVIIFLSASPTRTIAQDEPPLPMQDAGLDALAWFNCTISDIAVFSNPPNPRIHVRCTTSPGSGVFYFAVPSTYPNEMLSNRYLTLLNTAFALNERVYIQYDSLSANNPPGCNVGDCRLIVGLLVDKAP